MGIGESLKRREERGYLNDRAFALSFVRRRGAARGPRALSAELASRGVDRAQVDTAGGACGGAGQLAAPPPDTEPPYPPQTGPTYPTPPHLTRQQPYPSGVSLRHYD